MESKDDDKEFEKFLMASISGSEGTSVLNTGRDRKSIEWNLSSSEDVTPRNSKFLKSTINSTDIQQQIPHVPAESQSTKSDHTKSESRTKDDGILSVLEGIIGADPHMSESFTETGQTESLERQEFANRLAQQNSVLVSLGHIQNGSPHNDDRRAQTGTLEGLEELQELIEENKIPKIVEATPTEEQDVSKTESIFSDASKSDDDKGILSTSNFSSSSSNSMKSNVDVTHSNQIVPLETSITISNGSEHNEKSYSAQFDESVSSELSEKNEDAELLYANDLQPAGKVEIIDFDVEKEIATTPIEHTFKQPEDPIAMETVTKATDETVNEIELGGTKTNEHLLDKIFSNSVKPKITVADFALDDSEMSQTKDISIAESSLVEMLNIYEDVKNQRNMDLINYHQESADDHEPLKLSVTGTKKRPKSAPKKVSKKADINNANKTDIKVANKTSDFSHVKSSGYGSKTVTLTSIAHKSSRPRISPRLTAKVEAAKTERKKNLAQRVKGAENDFYLTDPEPLNNDETLETLVDTLKEEVKQERKLRTQLEESHLREITKNRTAEVGHRQEIIRILSTQEIPSLGHIGDGDNAENDALISGYQLENERLYQRTKDLEKDVKRLESAEQGTVFNNDIALSRLEGLLAKEEALRRKIEISAREAKSNVQVERTKNEKLVEDMKTMMMKLEAAKNAQDRVQEQLLKKEKNEFKLRTEIEKLRTQSVISNNTSEDVKKMTRLKNDEIELLKQTSATQREEVNRLERQLSRQMSSKKRHNSISSQTDSESVEVNWNQWRKAENNELKQIREELCQKLKDKTETALKFEMEIEKQKYEINRLSRENSQLQPLITKCDALQEQLGQAHGTRADIDTLKSQLGASLDDRQVFEDRYFQSVEALKVGQVEIDKRHNLVVDLHNYSMEIVKDFQHVEREKKALEIELENSRYEIDALKRSTLPENLANLSQKLTDMESDRCHRDKRMQKALTSADPDMNRMIADQTGIIMKLKHDLTFKNNQFNRSQLQIREMENSLIQLREQVKSANYLIT